jgi:2-dehydropantoate 2-reductase
VIDSSVLVVGAGAIGGIAAGLLTGAVSRVVVLDANAEHVERLRSPGLLLDRLGSERRVSIEAYTSMAEIDGHFEFALISVKAPALDEVLAALAQRDPAETYVSLGNGLIQDRIAEALGGERLIVGTVEWGGTNLGPGHLRQTTDNPFVIGELDGPVRARTRRLATVLEPVADVRLTENIAGQLWSKLLVNSSLSGLGVVGGCLYGNVAEHPVGRDALIGVWSEGVAIGLAQDLQLEEVLGIEPAQLASGDERVRSKALATVVRVAGATKASMLQDVERGLKSEVDVINGSVVARAHGLGMEAPMNARIVELVHDYEEGRRSPSVTMFSEVLAAQPARTG